MVKKKDDEEVIEKDDPQEPSEAHIEPQEQEEPKELEKPTEQEETKEETSSIDEQIKALNERLDAVLSRLEADPAEEDQTPIDDGEMAYNEREAALFQRQIDLELKAEGLEDFKAFISADNEAALTEQIATLKELKGKLTAENSYKPSEHKDVSDFAVAKKNRDVRSMIRTKF